MGHFAGFCGHVTPAKICRSFPHCSVGPACYWVKETPPHEVFANISLISFHNKGDEEMWERFHPVLQLYYCTI